MSILDTVAAYQSRQIDKQTYIEAMYEAHKNLLEYAELLKRTDIAHIDITEGQVIITWRSTGVRMLLAPDRRTPPLETLNFSSYEHNEAAMLLKLLPPSATVLDIGANIGWYSLTLAVSHPEAHVIAFEPVPETFKLLKQNIELNQVKNISAYNIGLSDNAGELDFYVQPHSMTAASSAPIDDVAAHPVRCRICTLDEIVDGLDLEIDAIKCDVEGAELLVFRGGIETLRRCQPVIFSEMLRKWASRFGYHPNDIIALMLTLGYECFTVHGSRLVRFDMMSDQTVETNFFFLHSSKHQAYIAELTEKYT